MRLIVYFIVSSLAGFGMHRFSRPADDLGKNFGNLARYGIGEAALIPIRALFRDALEQHEGQRQADRESQKDIATAADVLAVVSFGGGVVSAYLLDWILEK